MVMLPNEALHWVIRRMHYPLAVMLVRVRWHAAYPLSLRHILEMMAKGSAATLSAAGSAGATAAAARSSPSRIKASRLASRRPGRKSAFAQTLS
jgi:hypothetical protein